MDGIVRAILLVALLFAAAQTEAATEVESYGFYTGAEVLQNCTDPLKPIQIRSTQELLDAGACAGFVGAISDAARCESAGVNSYRAATPSDMNLLQVAVVVEKWLDEHPSDLHMAGSGLVARALSEAWPCQKLD